MISSSSGPLFELRVYTDRPGHVVAPYICNTEGVEEHLRSLIGTYHSSDVFFKHEVVVTIRPHADESEAARLQTRLTRIEDILNGG